MKKNIINLSILIIILSSVFSSCKKESEEIIPKEQSSAAIIYKTVVEFDANIINQKSTISIRINDVLQTLPADQQPTIINNRTMLPMNWVFTQLGFTVTWEQSTKKVTAIKGTQKIELWIDNTYAIVNNQAITLDVAPKLINSRTYIPVYVVGMTAVSSVQWVNQTTTVNIYNWDKLNYGFYWIGPNGDYQKAIQGETNPFYSSTKPTVILAYGWQPGGVASKGRPDLHWVYSNDLNNVDVWTQNKWIEQGWNVGVFMWTQLADESMPWDAESKIWSINSSVKNRWKKSDGTYENTNVPNKRVGELFYTEYTKAMQNYSGNNIRMVGYSFGHQLVAYLMQRLYERGLPNLMPDRVTYCDPAWTSGEYMFYLDNESDLKALLPSVTPLNTMRLVTAITKNMKSQFGFAFEQYKSSLLSTVNFYNTLDHDGALTELKPYYYTSWQIADKHGAAAKWYFWSKFSAAPPEYARTGLSVQPTGNVAASASTTDDRIKQMTTISNTKWTQYTGTSTCSPGDDTFERVLNLN